MSNVSNPNQALLAHCQNITQKSHESKSGAPSFIAKYKEITNETSDANACLAKNVLLKASTVPAVINLFSRKALAPIGAAKISPEVMDFISDPQVASFIKDWSEKKQWAKILQAYEAAYNIPKFKPEERGYFDWFGDRLLPKHEPKSLLDVMMAYKENWSSKLVKLQESVSKEREIHLEKYIVMDLLLGTVCKIIAPNVGHLGSKVSFAVTVGFIFCVCELLVRVPALFGFFDAPYESKY